MRLAGIGQPHFEYEENNMFINRHLLAFVKGHGGRITTTCLLQLVLTLLGSLISLSIAFAVRMIQGETKILFFNTLWEIFICIALLIGLRYVFARIRSLVSERCGLAIKSSLRDTLLKKVYALGPAYTTKNRTGDIASTISSKVEFLNEYYTIYLPSAVSAILNAGIIISVLGVLDSMSAVVCIIACAGLLICPMVFYFLMRERGAEEMRMHSQYYSDCLDSVQGMATLKAFNANAHQKDIIHRNGEKLRKAVMAQLRITMLENVVLQFFAGLGSAFSLAVAAYQCVSGNMEQEFLVYALFLIGACFAPMQVLIQAWHMGYRGVTASYSIEKLLYAPVTHSLTLNEAGKDRSSVSVDGDIRFDNVTFAYNNKDGNVLNNISFTIPRQTTTALVGASGSGKSTIAQLLAGFYSASSGSVSVGDTILNEETVSDIQNSISAVWQDCHIFYGTVEDNIRIGKPDATMEEIIHAAKEANIHDFIISLPEGYHTQLGESGMRFSGGERQRIALARAFLRNASIVILDEATSSLDRKNEIAVQESFLRLSHGKTALVIAHRLATIQNADQIIIMDDGRIMAKGSHSELMKTSAVYRKLMGAQMEGGTEYAE